MPRRKYRLFTLCSVIVLFMLYRVARNSWEEPPGFGSLQPPAFPLDSEADPESNIERPKPLPDGVDPPVVAVEDFAKVEVPDLKEQDEPAPVDRLALQKEKQEQQEEASTKGSKPQAGSGTQIEPEQPEVPAEKVHWVKQPENFPLAEDKITRLPSGTPKKIPKIQFEFAPETAEAKTRREVRLQNITGEIERSWGAYRKYAWMHDELSPVSGESRDPFCGWAATLVDSLDTLWIAGLKEAFDDAATAVAEIDFTWSTRRDIPVFETTIRYLGGLLAAYDVSGGAAGKYKILLDKAIELAEVLMGVFDTPNRMPDLYYKWEPQYASQPRRASQVGIAELGTLSMEFTRLAQLTGSHKYYDAINRITDALIEMQKSRHVSIPGLFPQGIDASGCKRIMRPDPKAMSDAAQAQLTQNKDLGAPVGYTGDEDIITPAGHAPIDEEHVLQADQDPRLQKRGTDTQLKDGWVADGVQPRKRPPYNAKGEGVDWDCEPQALVPDSYAGYYYSMGGSQDSAYEYFPKEYLLLGGLEPKYQKLHEDTVDAVDKWLMFRPMIQDSDNWDILFTGKATSWAHPKDRTMQYEMTHLACFLGGMYGIGAKIFGRDKDLETAKKLTDGCVWAYQMTPTGLMPEAAEILNCPTLEKCDFNQTLWEDSLDGSKEWRTEAVAKWDEEAAARKLAEQQAASALEDSTVPPVDKAPGDLRDEEAKLLKEKAAEADAAAEAQSKVEHAPVERPAVAPVDLVVERPGDAPVSGGLSKRAAIPLQEPVEGESQMPESPKDQINTRAEAASAEVAEPERPVPHAEYVDTPEGSNGATTNSVPQLDVPQKAWAQPMRARPMTHEEWVKERIENDGMRPGMVNLIGQYYILRPEAIESVWYMYRITGDPSWQEKGWAMYEATMRATRTELANSAIENVMTEEVEFKDEMESFWLAETLKYYYLLFAEPDVISLDEWVLNTEAHPFKRPT